MKKRIFIVIAMLVVSLSAYNCELWATSGGDGSIISSIFQKRKNWEENGEKYAESYDQAGEGTIRYDLLNNASNNIYNLLMVIAIGVAFIVGAILGIQLITSSVDQKSQAKQAFVPYAISCVVVFGSLGIWKLVVSLLGSIG